MGGRGVGGNSQPSGPQEVVPMVWRMGSGTGLTCGPGPMGPIPLGGFILCMGPPMLGCPVGRKAGVLHSHSGSQINS